MKIKSKIVKISLALFVSVLNLSFIKNSLHTPRKNSISIHISHFVGQTELMLDSVTYKNEMDQDFTITKLKYYIGNIVLKTQSGTQFKSANYFLVDEELVASKHITLQNVPPADYTSLEFIIGVDSVHNCSGAQSGALDPTNAMFWSWNTGYIFFKMEGKSTFSKSPLHLLEYHVGGYKFPNNCNRKIVLDISGGQPIRLKADLSELFRGPAVIDFTKLSTVNDFRNATFMADNYQDIFSILKTVEKD